MCLITTDKTCYTADKDIPVIKLLSKERTSLYHKGTVYPFGQTVHSSLKTSKSIKFFDIITEEHITKKFNLTPCIWDLRAIEYEGKIVSIGQGLHTLGIDREVRVPFIAEKYNAYIPKGAKYYKNETGEYASTRLVVLDEIRPTHNLQAIHLIEADFNGLDEDSISRQYVKNHDCPIARCLKRMYPSVEVTVSPYQAHVGECSLYSEEFTGYNIRKAADAIKGGATSYKLVVGEVQGI